MISPKLLILCAKFLLSLFEIYLDDVCSQSDKDADGVPLLSKDDEALSHLYVRLHAALHDSPFYDDFGEIYITGRNNSAS